MNSARAQLRKQFKAALADLIADYCAAHEGDIIACLNEALLTLEADELDRTQHEQDRAYGKQLSMKQR